MAKHSELAYAPLCSPEKNGAWFAISFVRYSQREARADFVKAAGGNGDDPAETWKALKIEGWRIVRVKVVAQ